jgi:hypothetical protein
MRRAKRPYLKKARWGMAEVDGGALFVVKREGREPELRIGPIKFFDNKDYYYRYVRHTMVEWVSDKLGVLMRYDAELSDRFKEVLRQEAELAYVAAGSMSPEKMARMKKMISDTLARRKAIKKDDGAGNSKTDDTKE